MTISANSDLSLDGDGRRKQERVFHIAAQVHSAGLPGTAVQYTLIKHLNAVRKELTCLKSDSEKQFLLICDCLHELHDQAKDITQTSLSITGFMSGDKILSSINGLGGTLDRITDYLSGLKEKAQEDDSTLQKVLELLLSTQNSVQGLERIIKLLAVLSVSIRIESSRIPHGREGFETLAGHVEKLSQIIKNKSRFIIKESRQIDRLIKQTLLRVLSVEADQRKDAEKVLGEVRSGLEVLVQKYGMSVSAANSVSSHADEISASMGELITALQFHDITRQQIEYVENAADDLNAELEIIGGGSLNEAGILPGNLEKICAICHTQCVVLAKIGEMSQNAGTVLSENLKIIADNVAEMAGSTREVAGITGVSGRSALLETDKGVLSVAKVLSLSTEARRELAAGRSSVGKTVGTMAAFVSDIEAIQSEIQIIALNSQLKAAQAGADGAALGVLAQAIQNLSSDTHNQTILISGTLEKVVSSAHELRAEYNDDLPDVFIEEILSDLQDLLHSLKLTNKTLTSLFKSVEEKVEVLSTRIKNCRKEIKIHISVPEAADKIISLFDEISSEAKRLITPSSTNTPFHPQHTDDGFQPVFSLHLDDKKTGAKQAATSKISISTESCPEAGDNIEFFS